mmetsp:Transcript_107911/g.305223  ORF Transcript_107911/g.305223 Transcript_107911/m.305223 type:complete len:206 (+) Transcript_107911:244-861(+)
MLASNAAVKQDISDRIAFKLLVISSIIAYSLALSAVSSAVTGVGGVWSVASGGCGGRTLRRSHEVVGVVLGLLGRGSCGPGLKLGACELSSLLAILSARVIFCRFSGCFSGVAQVTNGTLRRRSGETLGPHRLGRVGEVVSGPEGEVGNVAEEAPARPASIVMMSRVASGARRMFSETVMLSSGLRRWPSSAKTPCIGCKIPAWS